MSDELLELCNKYELTGDDMFQINWFLAREQKGEAVRYLQPKVGYDYLIAKKL